MTSAGSASRLISRTIRTSSVDSSRTSTRAASFRSMMTSAIRATRFAFSCPYGIDVTTIVLAPRAPSSTS